MLANLYLHWFDALFHGPQGPARKADVKLVRYADDFVALAKQMGSETIEFIEALPKNALGKILRKELHAQNQEQA